MTRSSLYFIVVIASVVSVACAGASGDESDGGIVSADAAIEAAIFVSKTGNDTFDGRSPESALLTINTGLTKSRSCEPGPCTVRISVGEYVEQVVLFDGAQLRGGYSADFSDHNPAAWPVVVSSEQTRTVIGDALTRATQLDSLTIRGADLSATADGRSSYAVWLRGATNVRISNTIIEGGNAAPGADGNHGDVMACDARGGTGGGAYDCGSNGGGTGEAGIDTASAGGGGGGGSNNCPSACPLVGSDGISSGSDGTNGGDGASGVAGDVAANNVGEFVDGLWQGAGGHPGTRGQHGTGGGGGGSGGSKKFAACFGCGTLVGGRGGDGASGGCAGQGGEAGQPGGSSFGLVLIDSNLEIANVTITAGDAGKGGDGGNGHLGAPGGNDGSVGRQPRNSQQCGLINYHSGAGGYGGSGGKGGAGGGGAGGVGGVSIGVALIGEVTLDSTEASTIAQGAPGPGGMGGTGGDVAGNGREGLAAPQLTF